MKGKNTITVNQATARAAFQMYFNSLMLKDNEVDVLTVKHISIPHGSFEIEVEGASEEDNGN